MPSYRATGGMWPPIIRTYRGRQQSDALTAFQRDAAELAKSNYYPTTQSWAQGQWGCGAFLVALLLFVVLVGILIFIYMLLVKPEGTLTVTYERRAQAQLPATQAIPAAVGGGPEEAIKVCPQCAETVKAAALICRYCRYEFRPLPPSGQPGT
jgi:hypothetical protein